MVAGASMAGLLCAAALAEHYEQVSVVEPDVLDGADDPRRGTPQAGQAHALLVRGAEAIEDLLPGVTGELGAAGAVVAPLSMGPDQGMRLVGPAGPFADVTSDATFIGATRALLERTVRRRVLAHPRITLHRDVRAGGLLADPGGATVRGVRLLPADGGPGCGERLAADLVVDATGRRSRAPQWLAALGHAPVPETLTHPRVGYASRVYRRPARPRHGWMGTLVNARPGENPRFGLLLPAEDGTCTVGLGGFAGHYPPTDDAGFLRWARDLADPCLHDALTEAEPLCAPRAYRTPTSRWRHFDRLTTHPDGFLAVGDAVGAFNPVYGQGMSVAALHALALRRVLRTTTGEPARPARRAVARAGRGPWDLAAGQDRAWSDEADRRRHRRGARARDRFLRAVQHSATTDPVVAGAFAEVMLMRAGPARLIRPHIVARVLRPRRAGTAHGHTGTSCATRS